VFLHKNALGLREKNGMRQKKSWQDNVMLRTIIEGIIEKKGKEIVCIDLSRLDYAICSYFVICHGDSVPHVQALADFLEQYAGQTLGVRPYSVQGMENSLWVVMDFGDIFVHIFKGEVRSFYSLEGLWADGHLTQIDEPVFNQKHK
jgi:ribosome-associated protein